MELVRKILDRKLLRNNDDLDLLFRLFLLRFGSDKRALAGLRILGCGDIVYIFVFSVFLVFAGKSISAAAACIFIL